MTTKPEVNSKQLLTYFDALQILHIVKSTENCESVRLRFGETRISLERASTNHGARSEGLARIAEPAVSASAVQPPSLVTEANSALGATIEEAAEVTAPIVGFSHQCSEAGEALPTQVGDMVQATDTIGIVKSMRISKPVLAGVSGQVIEICVADAGFVEYGQPVLRITRTG